MKSQHIRGAIALLMMTSFAAVAGCDDAADPNSLDGRHNYGSSDPNSTAAGESNTYDHAHESVGGENGITNVAERQQSEGLIGTPDEVSRLHGAQKISYVELGKILTDLGVTITGAQAPKAGAVQSAAQLYTFGKGALGAPIFSSRTPEMTTPSTSALAKEYDIFVAGAPMILTNIGTASKRCPGVVLVQAGQFTSDGLSCLMGKPATADHLALANKMITDLNDPTNGTAVAVATVLAATHISE